jgi:hypothetical protein
MAGTTGDRDRIDSYRTGWTGQNYVIKSTLNRTGIYGLSQAGQDRETWDVPLRTGQETGWDGLSLKEKTGQERTLGFFCFIKNRLNS